MALLVAEQVLLHLWHRRFAHVDALHMSHQYMRDCLLSSVVSEHVPIPTPHRANTSTISRRTLKARRTRQTKGSKSWPRRAVARRRPVLACVVLPSCSSSCSSSSHSCSSSRHTPSDRHDTLLGLPTANRSAGESPPTAASVLKQTRREAFRRACQSSMFLSATVSAFPEKHLRVAQPAVPSSVIPMSAVLR